jgi:hypothetical protein
VNLELIGKTALISGSTNGTHDRISGIPGRAKLIEEFVKYAKKQKGVVFMRKDEIAKWASASKIPHEG